MLNKLITSDKKVKKKRKRKEKICFSQMYKITFKDYMNDI